MIVDPGCFMSAASASRAVMKSPAMNSPLPSMKKQRSASPSHAMPTSAPWRTTSATMSARFSSSSGLASWFGNVPSTSKHSFVVRHGRRSNRCGATRPAMPLPASSTVVKSWITVGSMNPITCSTYGAMTSSDVTVPRVAAGAGSDPVSIISRISLRPDSPLSGNASRFTSLQPLYCLGLCEAVICAPPSRPCAATAKYIMSVPARPQSTTCTPCIVTPSMNAVVSDGDDRRMSRVTATRPGPRNTAKARPSCRNVSSLTSDG